MKGRLPLIATFGVLVLIWVLASLRYDGFLSATVLGNLIRDNAFLGLAAIGMTFVILSGGIDLSVGAMIGFSSILVASLITRGGMHPVPAMASALVAGTLLGAGMGLLIVRFALPPFLVTLAGMFLARGLAFVISLESIPIRHPFYGGVGDPGPGVFLIILGLAVYVSSYTRFGRSVYATGGNESNAALMGVPVDRTKVMVYALSGFCAALAGVVLTTYTSAGNATAGTTLELDAIAAVVIGGTLLSGGVGHVLGTLGGVMILGTIQTVIIFEGTLSSWWTKIVAGVLLLAFVLMQRVGTRRVGTGTK